MLNLLFNPCSCRKYLEVIPSDHRDLQCRSRPGTRANRHKQAHSYITFCVHYRVDYLAPSILDVSMYTQWLANSHSSPSSVKNYLSGAKNWVLEHRGCIDSFISYSVAQMIKSVTKHSQHVVKRAAPLFPNHLLTICSYCDYSLMVPLAVKPCILIGFALYLRASNLVSPTTDVYGGPHTLRANDVVSTQDKLVIRICSTKTQIKPVEVNVFAHSCPTLCPVRAWHNYVSVISPDKAGPAFIVSQGRSLTAKLVVTCIKQALMYDPTIDLSKVSIHSLRRGAAQTAARSGASNDEIMVAGSWSSKSGLKPYLSP